MSRRTATPPPSKYKEQLQGTGRTPSPSNRMEQAQWKGMTVYVANRSANDCVIVIPEDGQKYRVPTAEVKFMRRQASPIEYDHDTGGWLLTSDLGESGHTTAIDDEQQPIKSGAIPGPVPTPPPEISGAVETLDQVATAVASVDKTLARRLKQLSREASRRVAMGISEPSGGATLAGPSGGSPPGLGAVPGMGTPSPEDLYSTSVFTREDEQLCGPPNDANQSRKFKHEIWERFPANESQLGPKPDPSRTQSQASPLPNNLPSKTPIAGKRKANPCPYPEFVEKLSRAAQKVKKLGKDRYKQNELAFHKAEKAIDNALRQASRKAEKKCGECGTPMSKCDCGSGKKASRRRAADQSGAPVQPAGQVQSQTAPPAQKKPMIGQAFTQPQQPQTPTPTTTPQNKPMIGQAFTQPQQQQVPTVSPEGQQATNNRLLGQAFQQQGQGPVSNATVSQMNAGVNQAISAATPPAGAPTSSSGPQTTVTGSARKASNQSPWDTIKRSLKRVASGGGRWGKGEWEVTPGDYGKTLDLNVNTRLDDGTPLVASTVTFSLVKEDRKGRTATVEVHDAALHHRTRELRIPLSKAKLFAQEWARNTEKVAKSCLKGE